MARKHNNNKWARPIPGNTMVVTVPFEQVASTPIDMGLGPLFKNFPMFGGLASFKPIAYKIVSVSVASTATVAAKVRFKDGLQFEDAIGSGKVLKCRPAKDGVIGGWHAIRGSMASNPNSSSFGVSVAIDGETLLSPTYGQFNVYAPQTQVNPFSFAGELKAVTIAFRLPDGATGQ